MLSRRRFLVLIGVGAPAAAVTAAGIRFLPSEEAPTGDPNIAFGEDICERCSMVVSDRRFAAAWRDSNGREAYFDDIGCMVHEAHDQAIHDATLFVPNYDDETWLYAEDAFFVMDDEFRTPMAFGIAAFDSEDAASQAPGGHMVMHWDDLKPALDRKGEPDGHHH